MFTALTLSETLWLIFIIMLPIGLMVLAFKSRHAWIFFPTMIFWLLLVLFCHQRVDPALGMMDTFAVLRLLAIGFTVVTPALFFIVRPKTTNEHELDDREQYLQELREFQSEVKAIRSLGIRPRPKPQRPRTILYGRKGRK